MKNETQYITLPVSSPRKKRWLLPLIGLLVIAAVGVGWKMSTNAGSAVAKPDEQKKLEVQELALTDFITVEARELSVKLPISGTLTPLNQAMVKSKVTGTVQETPIQEGIKVARGDVVMRMDTGDLQSHLVQQQANEEDAKAKLALALKNHESNQTLLRQKFISQNAYDTAENNVDIARAALKSATSQVEIARRALEDATVHAPIDGIVSKRFLQVGEKASPDTPLFSMVDLRQMTLEAQVPASEIPRVKEGQSVNFDVEGFDSRHFTGKVARINPTADAGSRSMTVYVAVNNEDGALRGGMFAKGGITLQKSAPQPVVPLAAIRQEDGVATVLKIENNKVVAQVVKVGLRNEDESMAVIGSGLQVGERIIALKLDGVKAGSPVKLPQNAAKPTPSAQPEQTPAVVTATSKG
jgi:membrane fusion protein (multidrug efflux system)